MSAGTRARVLTALLLVVAAVAAPVASSDDGPGEATIAITFSSDGTTATIVSSKGISHYVYVLCDGTSQKVEGLGEVRSITIGPFAVGIRSVTVKSATTVATSERDCAPPPPPPPPPPGPPPTDLCPNIAGDQATVPGGMVKDSSGNCAAPPPSVRVPVVDVEVVKTDAPDPVGVGQRITYTIRVINRGPEAATNVVATDPLPASVTLVSVSTTQPLRCELGRIESGATVTITAVVRANEVGLVVNTASAAASEPDPNPANNVSTATTRVVAPFQPPAVRCDKLTVSPRSLRVGKTSTLRIRVSARGKPVRVLVLVRGAGISTSYMTNRAGTVTVKVRPRKAGIIRFFVRGSACSRRLGAVAPFQPPLTG